MATHCYPVGDLYSNFLVITDFAAKLHAGSNHIATAPARGAPFDNFRVAAARLCVLRALVCHSMRVIKRTRIMMKKKKQNAHLVNVSRILLYQRRYAHTPKSTKKIIDHY